MHFLAKDAINLGNLHAANLLRRSVLIHGMVIGLIAGGVTGALLGFLVSLSPEVGAAIGMGGVLVLAILGALVGTWASGMIAVSIPNTRLKRFQCAIDRGHILLLVAGPVRRVGEICNLIRAHHPEAQSRGQDTQIPAFP